MIPDLASLTHEALGEGEANPFATKFRTKVETFHLADFGIKFMKRDAACELAFVFGEQKSALGRSIVTGKFGEFPVEVLETKAEAEGLGILQEEFAGLGEVSWGRSVSKRQSLYHRGHGGHRVRLMIAFQFSCSLF
jgi:hypothetical protein